MYVYTYIHTYIPVTRAGGFGQLKGIALFQVTNPSRARALGVQKKFMAYTFRAQLWRAREGAWEREGGERVRVRGRFLFFDSGRELKREGEKKRQMSLMSWYEIR
jgi:hypothetical protein